MRTLHTPAYQAFLERLLAAREEAGMSQISVAQALRVPQSRVSRMETGQTRVDVAEIVAFMQLYRKPFDYFMPGSGVFPSEISPDFRYRDGEK